MKQTAVEWLVEKLDEQKSNLLQIESAQIRQTTKQKQQ